MADYKPQRSRNLYQPGADKPFKLSRSKVDAFLKCPHCFYVDRRLGVQPPSGPPFNLNSAVDALLKKEFDEYRARQEPHPLMQTAGIDAIPFAHEQLDAWRENFKGVQYHHEATNLVLTGAIDDLWQNPAGELIVVDYKATSKNSQVNLDSPWQIAYKRQMEFYQWLLRRNGFAVHDTGYFVYCNGRKDLARFDGRLEFHIDVLPYTGDDGWVEGTLDDIHACLNADTPPAPAPVCDQCSYNTVITTL